MPLLAGVLATVAAAQTTTQATVYRDVHGVPHITAEDEATAWYALGYEQARDALLWIQYTCKAGKGELSWVRGVETGFDNDCAVKVFNSHGRLAAMSEAQRRAWFAPTDTSIQANFYDNCVAFAAGANAWRESVRTAPPLPLTPERRLRDWLGQNALPQGQASLAWVYNDPIEAVDIAAQGAWTTAVTSFFWPGGIVNSDGASYGFAPGGKGTRVNRSFLNHFAESDTEPDIDPLSPGAGQRWREQIRQKLELLPGAPSAFSGSSSFAWSRLYCKDAWPGTNSYAGLLGDPHQPVPFAPPNLFATGFYFVPNHLWYAHVKVTPPSAKQPSLDILGHVPHASACFFTGHGRNVAMGGTLAGPNYLDNFLLRLREGTGGFPDANVAYYSYYHDTSQGNQTFEPVTAHQITIKRPDNQGNWTVPYWRAQHFGVILPRRSDVKTYLTQVSPLPPVPQMPVFYGERVEPNLPAPRWRVGIAHPGAAEEPKMRYWNAPQLDAQQQLLTSPMAMTLRAPLDQAVAGEPMHSLLLRDIWELGHARQVRDVIAKTNGAAYPVNVCFVDREGRTFSTQLSAVPERGDDAQLASAGYHTLDKWLIYSKNRGPVPARHYDDRKFDWRFDTYTPTGPQQLRYLRYPTGTTTPTTPFKAMALQDQLANTAFPPTSFTASGPFHVESGFFASTCNDLIWGFSRRRDFPFFSGTGFADVVVPGNQLFQYALDCGVVYQTAGLGFEAPAHQQFVVDRFTRQAEYIVRGGASGLPPQTPVQMRQFVVQPEFIRDESYLPPRGATANAALPTVVRQLQEVAGNAAHHDSPQQTAKRELQFFRDLWTNLFQGTWDQHVVAGAAQPLTLSLRDLWINGSVPGHPELDNKVFWYDDPTNPTAPGLRWIDLPADFPLIDFFWPESDVSNHPTAGPVTTGAVDPDGLSASEHSTLSWLVSQLVNWGPAGTQYRNVPASYGACLLEMMRMRFDARGPTYGRHWVRLKRGQVQYPSGWSALTTSGALPVGAVVRQDKAWAEPYGPSWRAFPLTQLETLLRPVGVTTPDAALYDPASPLQVRRTLGPEETNALVKFFLELGGYYIEPRENGGNPSRKLSRFQIANQGVSAAQGETNFLNLLPGAYPLTDGLQRLTVPRALLDTAAYLQSLPGVQPGTIPPLSLCFRARAYDHAGQRWPAQGDNECVGGGGVRSVFWNVDFNQSVAGRGLQPKFFGLSGSIATLMAMFPSAGNGVDSYFWSTPGNEMMTSDPSRFDAHMNAFATATLLPTHFDDFDHPSNLAWSVVHTWVH